MTTSRYSKEQFIDSIVTGTAADAEAWVHSSTLPDRDKHDLLRFIRRFPSLRFYKHAGLRLVEQCDWAHATYETLAGVFPGTPLWMRFDDHDGTVSGERPLKDILYHRYVFRSAPSSEYDRVFLDRDELLFVGTWLETLQSLLAVRAGNGEDRAVYEFSYKDIVPGDKEDEGHVAPGSAQVVFPSYAAMLSRIGTIQTNEVEVAAADR